MSPCEVKTSGTRMTAARAPKGANVVRMGLRRASSYPYRANPPPR
jgi:hypothetical protein